MKRDMGSGSRTKCKTSTRGASKVGVSRSKDLNKNVPITNKVLDDFIHELRSLLTPVLGWSDLLKKRKASATTWECAIDIINSCAIAQTSEISRFEEMLKAKRGMEEHR